MIALTMSVLRTNDVIGLMGCLRVLRFGDLDAAALRDHSSEHILRGGQPRLARKFGV
jgi:hypothetical protein